MDFHNLINAKQIVDMINEVFGSTGGGREDLAQAGGNNPKKAKELSLIDIIGTFDYSVKLISQRLNSDSKLELFYFKDENGSFFDLINSIYTFLNPINLDVFPLPQFSLYYGAN